MLKDNSRPICRYGAALFGNCVEKIGNALTIHYCGWQAVQQLGIVVEITRGFDIAAIAQFILLKFEIAVNEPPESVASVASAFLFVGCWMLSQPNLGVKVLRL